MKNIHKSQVCWLRINVIICFKLQFEGLGGVNLAKWRQLDRWNNYMMYQLYNVKKQNMNTL